MRRLTVTAFCLAWVATPAIAQQPPPGILQIFDQFSISNAVASKCVKPDKDKLTKFLVNYQIVSTQAAVQIKQMKPDITPEQIDHAMKDRYELADKRVSDVIAQETCDGPRIKEGIRRFDAQASMDLTGAGKPK